MSKSESDLVHEISKSWDVSSGSEKCFLIRAISILEFRIRSRRLFREISKISMLDPDPKIFFLFIP